MSFANLLPQTVTISSITDFSLDADRNWVRNSGTSSVRGRLELLDPKEADSGPAAVRDRWRLFLPAGTAITAADEVWCDGRRFQVDGTPNRVWDRTAEHHVEVFLFYVGDVAQTADANPGVVSGYGESGYGLGYYGGTAA